MTFMHGIGSIFLLPNLQVLWQVQQRGRVDREDILRGLLDPVFGYVNWTQAIIPRMLKFGKRVQMVLAALIELSTYVEFATPFSSI